MVHGSADSDAMKDLGKPGAGEPHARFDERGLETGHGLGTAAPATRCVDSAGPIGHRASPRLYPPGLPAPEPGREGTRGGSKREENEYRHTQRGPGKAPLKSPEQAQRFLEPFSSVCNHFRPRRHRLTATAYRSLMDEQRQIWREVTAVPAAR